MSILGFPVMFWVLLLLLILTAYFNFFHSPLVKAGSSRRLPEATISRHLAPRLLQVASSSNILTIFSWDGQYHRTVGGSVWLETIEAMLMKDITIRYLMLNGFPEDCKSLVRLYEKYPNFLKLYYWKQLPNAQTNLSDIRKKYEVFHPTYLTTKEEGALLLWLEHYHPHGSHIANNVEYVGTDDITNQRIIPFQTDFDTLVKGCFLVTQDIMLDLLYPDKDRAA